jgi:hypothetical protein
VVKGGFVLFFVVRDGGIETCEPAGQDRRTTPGGHHLPPRDPDADPAMATFRPRRRRLSGIDRQFTP